MIVEKAIMQSFVSPTKTKAHLQKSNDNTYRFTLDSESTQSKSAVVPNRPIHQHHTEQWLLNNNLATPPEQIIIWQHDRERLFSYWLHLHTVCYIHATTATQANVHSHFITRGSDIHHTIASKLRQVSHSQAHSLR